MAEHQDIIALAGLGWSFRRIAVEVGVDRETVSRHVRSVTMEPPGVGPPGSNAAISITGIAANDAAEGETGGAATDARRVAADDDPGAIAAGAHAAISITGAGRRSLCEPLRVVIEAKLQQGLTSQRIWQDLKAEHGFRDGYQSVQRFIRG